MSSDYSKLKRVGDIIYQVWEDRPDSPKWMAHPALVPLKAAIEVAEEVIDVQFEAAQAISQGKVRGKDQYGLSERERVESLGTKFIYSPGGYQI